MSCAELSSIIMYAGCSLMVYVVMTVVKSMGSCIASLYMNSLEPCSVVFVFSILQSLSISLSLICSTLMSSNLSM